MRATRARVLVDGAEIGDARREGGRRSRHRHRAPGRLAGPAAFGRREHLCRPPADAMARPGRRARACASRRQGADRPARRRHRSGAQSVARCRRRRRRSSRSPRRCRATCRILILDEPTAALTLTETEKLFDVVRRLAGNGVSVIYVSHRLAEIFALCHSRDRAQGRQARRHAARRRNLDRRADPADGRARGASLARGAAAARSATSCWRPRTSTRRRWCGRPRSPCGPARSSASPASSARAAANSARRSSVRARRRGGSIRIGGKADRSDRARGTASMPASAWCPRTARPPACSSAWTSSTTSPRPCSPRSRPACNFSNAKAEALAKNFVDELRIATPERPPDRRQSVGRQPAEGAARQMAGDGAAAADRRRADARRRCRRALRDLSPAARAGRQGRGAARRLLRPARGAGARRPHRRDGGRPHRRRVAGRRRDRGAGAAAGHPIHRVGRRSCASNRLWRRHDGDTGHATDGRERRAPARSAVRARRAAACRFAAS